VYSVKLPNGKVAKPAFPNTVKGAHSEAHADGFLASIGVAPEDVTAISSERNSCTTLRHMCAGRIGKYVNASLPWSFDKGESAWAGTLNAVHGWGDTSQLRKDLMDVPGAKSELSRILRTGVRELVDAGHRFRPPAQAGEWRLPEADLWTLSEYGLPGPRDDELMGVVAGFQPGGEPERVHEGSRFYDLGSFGSAQLAAQDGTGRVLAFPEFTEVHPQLCHLMPEGPVPVEVNSRVSALVECAWRWHWMVPVLAEQEVLAGKAEAEAWRTASGDEARAALPDFYAGCRELGRLSLTGLATFDPDVVGAEESFWAEAVLDL
jgi:hypothetical protein